MRPPILFLQWTVLFLSFFLTAEIRSHQKPGLGPQTRLEMVKTSQYEIVKADAEAIVVKFSLADFDVSRQKHDHKEYQTIVIDGFHQTSEPGKPQVPVRGHLFGIPPNTTPELDILSTDYIALPGYNIAPAPKPIQEWQLPDGLPADVEYEWWMDREMYFNHNFYPNQIAKLSDKALIRHQSVGTLQIFPVQFNPVSGEIRFYRTVTVRVRFVPKEKRPDTILSTSGTADSPAFERLLGNTLLNYQSAKNWRVKRDPLSKPESIHEKADRAMARDGYKIFVEQDGIYVVTKAELDDAGLNTAVVDPRKIRIFSQGVEIPIHIEGEQDGRFDVPDYIEFYGKKMRSDYTYTNVYWLVVDENIDGLRMAEVDGSLNGTHPVLTMAPERIRFEHENIYATSIQNGEGQDHWFWNFVIASNSLDLTGDLNNVADVPGRNGSIRVEYRGFTSTGTNPDHHTIVSLNGYQVLDDYWDGLIKFSNEWSFPQSLLANGMNTVSIYLPGDTGSAADVVYVNWFEIEYLRNYAAQNDSIIFWAEGEGMYQIAVTNFSNQSIALFDISDPFTTKKITNFTITQDGNSHTLVFQHSVANPHRYFALSEENRQTPEIGASHSVDLRSNDNQADYIIVTHEDFYSSLSPLIQLRQQQGLSVTSIKVTDIYDEFNYGIKNPRAIKDFLEFTFHHWQKPAPTYVLLVGDATYDFKDFLKTGHQDFVPTHLFESSYFSTETSSDNWFVSVSGDDPLPDMLIGRLPVQSTAEADAVVQKIIQYESSSPEDEWHSTMLFIAEGDDVHNDFEALSDSLIQRHVSPDVKISRVYRSQFSDSESTQDALLAKINQGSLIANYYGHGGIDFIARERLLADEDVANFQNGDRQPFFLSLSCLNGFFHHAEIENCLSETLLKAENRGAIACLSPSGFAYPSALNTIAGGIFRAIFKEQDNVAGSFATRSKIAVYQTGISQDHIDFYNLLGDPALRLKVNPTPSALSSAYYGKATIGGNSAPIGTGISAWIDNVSYPAFFTVRTPGMYGPMHVNGDEPNTLEVEGGSPGDTVSFRLVAPAGVTLFAQEAGVWQAGERHHLDLTEGPTSVPSSADISITVSIEDKIVGEDIFGGEPVSNKSILRAEIISRDFGIDADRIQLLLNGTTVGTHEFVYSPSENSPMHSGILSYDLNALADEDYEMTIEVTDLADPPNTAASNIIFQISSSFEIQRVMNFPNPMRSATTFTYYIVNNNPADVNIKIYTVAGRLIKVIDYAPGEIGYNSIDWDGRDNNFDELANGVYFYKISAISAEERADVIEKLSVMR